MEIYVAIVVYGKLFEGKTFPVREENSNSWENIQSNMFIDLYY